MFLNSISAGSGLRDFIVVIETVSHTKYEIMPLPLRLYKLRQQMYNEINS